MCMFVTFCRVIYPSSLIGICYEQNDQKDTKSISLLVMLNLSLFKSKPFIFYNKLSFLKNCSFERDLSLILNLLVFFETIGRLFSHLLSSHCLYDQNHKKAGLFLIKNSSIFPFFVLNNLL